MIWFEGDSFAANHLRTAALKRGLTFARKLESAHLVFIAQDTPILKDGKRDLEPIRKLIDEVAGRATGELVLTSQVPPGFTRSLKLDIYHQAETLRIKDAAARALRPEYICVGCREPDKPLPTVYLNYLQVWNYPLFQVSWEAAEFSKIAVNMTLASQVENTNRLVEACKMLSISWPRVAEILATDSRISRYSYLQPGKWQDSPHLLRDSVTLTEILARRS